MKTHLDLAVLKWDEARKTTDSAAHGTDNSIEHIILLCFPFLSYHRRLLTQLEAVKGSRGSAAGDSKPTVSAKGPDGVVLYELHSRPEQEKFNESAKVRWQGRWRRQSQVSGMHALRKWVNVSSIWSHGHASFSLSWDECQNI